MGEERFYPRVLKYLKSKGYMTYGLNFDGVTFDFYRLGRRAQADVIGIKDVGKKCLNANIVEAHGTSKKNM